MKKLLNMLRQYYERELTAMHGLNTAFANEFPAQAGLLGMEGGHCDDPHIERFAQATALSNARTAKLIDDNDRKVTEALLNTNYAHYLQPFPGTGVACADKQAAMATMTEPMVISRGTMLSVKMPNAPACMFQTVFPVALTPVVLTKVKFHGVDKLPPSLPPAVGVTAGLHIDLESKAANLTIAQLKLDALRVFIDAEQSLCATTRDVLFMHTQAAWIALEDGSMIALKAVPIRQVGFATDEALIPYPASSHQAYRLLTEYFAYPEKFNFFDIDLAALTPHLPCGCRRFSLRLGMAGVPADSHTARTLGALSSKNFVLGCTPVVNLFKRAACPINLTHTTSDHELMPDGSPAAAYDIFSVDKVSTIQQSRNGPILTEFRRYYSLRHGEAGGRAGRYYLIRRDPIKALSDPGHETRIALVDLDLNPLSVPDASVSIDLTCTNRDLPSRLRCGAAAGELTLEQAGGGHPLRFLRTPIPSYRFSAHDHWRLISHLSLSHCALAPDGLIRLQETLTLYDLPQSAVSRRQIAGITGLDQRSTRAWMREDGHSSITHGLAVRVTLDEDAFAGTGIHLFAAVLDHFFALYVHMHSFTQLTILSHASGKELIRCQPRSGAINLV